MPKFGTRDMNIPINKNFLKEYKDDAWKGFSTKELLSLVSAAAVGFGMDLLLHYQCGFTYAQGVYAAVPIAFLFIFPGFFKYQGHLSVWQLIKELQYEQETSLLTYNSGDYVEYRRDFTMNTKPDKKAAKKKRRKKHGCV